MPGKHVKKKFSEIEAVKMVWSKEKQRRSNICWRDLVPQAIAIQQESFERANTIMRLVGVGWAAKDIADVMGITVRRVHKILSDCNNRRYSASPVERWLRRPAGDTLFNGRDRNKRWAATVNVLA